MGQTLSEPITKKDTSGCSNSQYRSAASSMQGWRISMEDCHTQLLSMREDKDAAFFAVFDGHGGSKTAQYCGEHLHKVILGQQEYGDGDIPAALKSGFLQCDQNMLNDAELKDEMSGSTAVCTLLKDDKIYCANSGDSRAVASVDGICEELSNDHKPCLEEESRRIVAAGGWIEFNRVNGNLALSRAMGDFAFKRNTKKPPEEQIVTAYPEVIIKDITPEHEFILLACDGIWDVMSNQEVVDFIRDRIGRRLTPEQICEELLQNCLAPDAQLGGLGCDNMTVVLVCLLRGQSYEDLVEKCSVKRKRKYTIGPNGEIINTEEDEIKSGEAEDGDSESTDVSENNNDNVSSETS